VPYQYRTGKAENATAAPGCDLEFDIPPSNAHINTSANVKMPTHTPMMAV